MREGPESSSAVRLQSAAGWTPNSCGASLKNSPQLADAPNGADSDANESGVSSQSFSGGVGGGAGGGKGGGLRTQPVLEVP